MVSRKMREIECVRIRRENKELGGKRRRRTVEEKEDGGREGGRWKRRCVMWCMEENVWRASG